MNRRTLGFLAILIIVLMGIVATAGLDNLPRSLRKSVETATTQMDAEKQHLQLARAAVDRAIADEPELFRSQAASLHSRLGDAEAKLTAAAAATVALQKLAAGNRREDREKVEQGLAKIETDRKAAFEQAEQVRHDTERWLGYKRNLPSMLEQTRAAYETVHAWDAATTTAAAAKAMTDWPEKRADLQSRIDTLTTVKTEAEQAWETTAGERAKAEAKDWGAIDYAALIAAGDKINRAAKQLPQDASLINSLAAQLYVDRNKLLLDLNEDGFQQKVRVVETRDGNPAQQEKWETIGEARFKDVEDNVGMVVERKPTGKYDAEADRTPQAPAYAYVAPPGQANQYGSWNNGVWNWLPQYLILSQLLRGPGWGGPITHGDYDGYSRARRRGEVWMPRGGSGGSWRSGGSTGRRVLDALRRGGNSSSSGGWYSERSRSGGFGGSKYQSRGSFGGSKYQSRRGGFSGFGSRSYSRGGGFRGFGGRGGRR